MVRVWRNECLRVFHDRLINEVDKELVSMRSHPGGWAGNPMQGLSRTHASGTSKMAQPALAAKPEALSSIPGAYMVERELIPKS